MIALKMVLQIVDGRTNGHTLVVVKSLPRLKRNQSIAVSTHSISKTDHEKASQKSKSENSKTKYE